MAYAMKKKQYNKGSDVVRQGERMEYVWLIKSGVVRISHNVNSTQSIQRSISSSIVDEKDGTSEVLTVDIADLGALDCIGLVESMDENTKKSQRDAITLSSAELFFLP
jgi:hypothetical protein